MYTMAYESIDADNPPPGFDESNASILDAFIIYSNFPLFRRSACFGAGKKGLLPMIASQNDFQATITSGTLGHRSEMTLVTTLMMRHSLAVASVETRIMMLGMTINSDAEKRLICEKSRNPILPLVMLPMVPGRNSEKISQ